MRVNLPFIRAIRRSPATRSSASGDINTELHKIHGRNLDFIDSFALSELNGAQNSEWTVEQRFPGFRQRVDLELIRISKLGAAPELSGDCSQLRWFPLERIDGGAPRGSQIFIRRLIVYPNVYVEFLHVLDFHDFGIDNPANRQATVRLRVAILAVAQIHLAVPIIGYDRRRKELNRPGGFERPVEIGDALPGQGVNTKTVVVAIDGTLPVRWMNRKRFCFPFKCRRSPTGGAAQILERAASVLLYVDMNVADLSGIQIRQSQVPSNRQNARGRIIPIPIVAQIDRGR